MPYLATPDTCDCHTSLYSILEDLRTLGEIPEYLGNPIAFGDIPQSSGISHRVQGYPTEFRDIPQSSGISHRFQGYPRKFGESHRFWGSPRTFGEIPKFLGISQNMSQG
jgi:hypothetical protein